MASSLASRVPPHFPRLGAPAFPSSPLSRRRESNGNQMGLEETGRSGGLRRGARLLKGAPPSRFSLGRRVGPSGLLLLSHWKFWCYLPQPTPEGSPPYPSFAI